MRLSLYYCMLLVDARSSHVGRIGSGCRKIEHRGPQAKAYLYGILPQSERLEPAMRPALASGGIVAARGVISGQGWMVLDGVVPGGGSLSIVARRIVEMERAPAG